jgi:hypothetical protein
LFDFKLRRSGGYARRTPESKGREAWKSQISLSRHRPVSFQQNLELDVLIKIVVKLKQSLSQFQYVESMDVESWKPITPAIDGLMTWTRADGWTVAITVAELDLPRG